MRQVKQLRKGLQETSIWPLLKEREDVVPLLFPRAPESIYSSQVIVERIAWPTLSEEEGGDDDEDEDDDECSLETKCRITGFFRRFIENGKIQCVIMLN
ncbi:hypothetical protein EOD39_18621 [Acipenser ruthenus]|uniref:Uncharacterized protein n=1 Tax=Acipenser ruthenus TaxID=7906 RepID=A0A444V0E5_ACIRT|nr:hypothetical protein EOD39_18621 [Acipenser ruthenus]